MMDGFYAAFSLVILASGLALILAVACTPQQMRDISARIGSLADEVCVEGDSVGVCLKKCQAAEAGEAGGVGGAP